MPPDRLTREHIVPSGLSGTLILPEASCEDCQSIINKVETACLRGFLLPARLHLKLRRDKRGNGPKQIRLLLERDGKLQFENVGPENFPMIFAPVFTGPLYALGLPPSYDAIPVTIMATVLENAAVRWAALRTRSIATDRKPNIWAFSRMLAKIAHSFGAAELGLDNFRPFLVDEILGGVTLNANYYVGSSLVLPAGLNNHQDQLHSLTWYTVPEKKQTLVVVRIHSFH